MPLFLVRDQETGELELFPTESAVGGGQGLWLIPTFLHRSNLFLSCVIGSCVKLQNVLGEKKLRTYVTSKLGISSCIFILKQLHLVLVPLFLVSHQKTRILELFSAQLAIRAQASRCFKLSFHILDIAL